MMPPPPDADPTPRRETRRLLVVALIAAGMVALLHFTPLKGWLTDAQKWKDYVQQFGWPARLAFILASVAGIAIGVPRLLLCLASGLLFGALEGMLVAQASSMTGSTLTWLLARWGARDWVQRKLAGKERFRVLLSRPTIGSIFLVRQLPVPGLIANLMLGAAATPARTFLIGTFLGYLPSNLIVSLIGSSLGKDSAEKALGQVTLSIIALSLVSWIVLRVQRRLKSRS